MGDKTRILIVDDHTLFRSGLKALLEKEEDLVIVAEAENAEEAMKKLSENSNINLILMDIGMPGTDGLETTCRIKKEYPEKKIIVLTMYDDEPYLLKAMESGASGYVLKEAATTELVNAIRTVMQGELAIQPSLIKILVENALGSSAGNESTSDKKEEVLTEREKEVLQHVALGYTNQQIADLLVVSVKTVEKHKAHIMEKLKLKERHQLVDYAIKKGMLKLE
ncbi:MAG: response regulator transcription factor [Firmicutes bacterium]|nr:response regulator transcription factor [Bacillota bacterium]